MNSGSFRLKRGDHPSGYQATICEPTWVRPERFSISELTPAPWPGQHTREVLKEIGLDDLEPEEDNLAGEAALEGWKVLKHYLPL